MMSLWMPQRPCLAMCLLAAIGLLAPRLVLVLMWLINSSFVLQPFSGTSVPNPVLPILGLLFLPTTTLGFAGLWPRSEVCPRSVACWWC